MASFSFVLLTVLIGILLPQSSRYYWDFIVATRSNLNMAGGSSRSLEGLAKCLKIMNERPDSARIFNNHLCIYALRTSTLAHGAEVCRKYGSLLFIDDTAVLKAKIDDYFKPKSKAGRNMYKYVWTEDDRKVPVSRQELQFRLTKDPSYIPYYAPRNCSYYKYLGADLGFECEKGKRKGPVHSVVCMNFLQCPAMTPGFGHTIKACQLTNGFSKFGNGYLCPQRPDSEDSDTGAEIQCVPGYSTYQGWKYRLKCYDPYRANHTARPKWIFAKHHVKPDHKIECYKNCPAGFQIRTGVDIPNFIGDSVVEIPETGAPHGATGIPSCPKGGVMLAKEVYCLNGTWSTTRKTGKRNIPKCWCDKELNVPNAAFILVNDTFDVNSEAIMFCDEGYVLQVSQGSSTSTKTEKLAIVSCSGNYGRWKGPIPKCVQQDQIRQITAAGSFKSPGQQGKPTSTSSTTEGEYYSTEDTTTTVISDDCYYTEETSTEAPYPLTIMTPAYPDDPTPEIVIYDPQDRVWMFPAADFRSNSARVLFICSGQKKRTFEMIVGIIIIVGFSCYYY